MGERGEGFSYLFAGIMGGGSIGYLMTGLLTGRLGARAMPLISIALFLCTAIALLAAELVKRRTLTAFQSPRSDVRI